MARPIEEIYNSLVSKVSSQSGSSWSSLKDSMVGKELLWFGANIESDAEVLSDAVNGVVSLARYSADQLISYAYTQDVPLDLSRPSSVKVGFRGFPGGRAVVCAPFQLCLTIGTLSFYNIEYCRTDSEVTLYQGIPMQMLSGSSMVLLRFRGTVLLRGSCTWSFSRVLSRAVTLSWVRTFFPLVSGFSHRLRVVLRVTL